MISASGIDKTFAVGGEGVRSLRGVGFDAVAGEFLVAIGASGSGKTTLLRTIAGLEQPDAGIIKLREEVVFDAARGIDVPPQRRRLGMVFQSYAIWPHMTVLENVMLPLRRGHLRMKHEAARAAALRALDLVGIAALADRPAPLLSGGQQQRVALARALAVSSDVLLMDEPLSNLDARLREEVRGELKALGSRLGATVLYVTHDRAEAMGMGDRLLVLDHGVVLQIGPPGEIYERPSSRQLAEFMGRVNWIEGKAARDGRIETRLGLLRAARPAPAGTAVTLGIRPENATLVRTAAVANDAPNTVRATALSVQFLGSYAVIEIAAAGERLVVETRGGEALPEAGETVVVHLPYERLLLFARDPDHATQAAGAQAALSVP